MKPWILITGLFLVFPLGACLDAQDLIITQGGDLFLSRIDSVGEDSLFYSFSIYERSYRDGLKLEEIAYSGTDFFSMYSGQETSRQEEDLIVLRNGKILRCKITAVAGMPQIEYTFELAGRVVKTQVPKREVVLYQRSYLQRIDPEQSSREYYEEVLSARGEDMPVPAPVRQAVVEKGSDQDDDSISGEEDLLVKVNGDSFNCVIKDIDEDRIYYQFPLAGRLAQTGIPRGQVHYLVRDQKGVNPQKILITPVDPEDFSQIIITDEGEVIPAFIDQVSNNGLTFYQESDSGVEFKVIKGGELLYFGEDFLALLDSISLKDSRYEDLIVTRRNSVLLCDIESQTRGAIYYSFMMGGRKMKVSIAREEVIYSGPNFFLLRAEGGDESPPPEPLPAEKEVVASVTPVVSDNEPPEVIILSPELETEHGFKAVENEVSVLRLSGVVLDPSALGRMQVNGEDFQVDDRGKFTLELPLESGRNRIRLKVEDEHGNEALLSYEIERRKAARSSVALGAPDKLGPEINLLSPGLTSEMRTVRVGNTQKSIVVSGRVSDRTGVYEVLVNGRDAALSASGDFSREVLLRVGENKVMIRACDLELNASLDSFTVIRSDAAMLAEEPEIMGSDDRFYALIIGVSSYPDPMIPNLDGHPTNDARKLGKLLTEEYMFDEDNLTLLINPSRSEILKSFDLLSRSITANDNLLIFFAGHGYYDPDANLGYWLPSDAESEFTANWIYNDVLVANLKRINSKHTLLISDACFSGSIFQTRTMSFSPVAYQKKYDLPSRKAITSGVLEAVPNQSVFFRYLADRLASNHQRYMSAGELFRNLEFPVSNNSPNSPQYGTIQNVDDQGGDFIFIRK